MSKKVSQPVTHIEGLENRQLMAAAALADNVYGMKIAKASRFNPLCAFLVRLAGISGMLSIQMPSRGPYQSSINAS